MFIADGIKVSWYRGRSGDFEGHGELKMENCKLDLFYSFH